MAAATLSTPQLMKIFGVGHMTIFNWRAGTATKEPLPFEQEGRNVSFKLGPVKAWAKKHGVSFAVAPDKVADETWASVKPGPKPKAKKKATARAGRTKKAH